ncbi:hypothetical protein KY346_00545 [Candidatus Woesearchaeota archaeon]|nr:hypothetical protein [Candidatus Woesearchaeota archaeon]
MNEEQITQEEYILEVLKDDLNTGRYPILQKSPSLITNANLLSEDENQKRLKLIQNNGAFGRIFEIRNFVAFYKSQIKQEEFLELFWCPKGNETDQDGIDLMSDNTRNIAKLIAFLKKEYLGTDPKIIQQIKSFFNEEIRKDKEIRLFLFETSRSKLIIDGNHRAGAIVKSISQENIENVFPITVYVAKIS